jgi:ubiquinone/menaquinone biosynthesis C-methylase UbiE
MLKFITKLYRLYNFYMSPARFIIRREIKSFFETVLPCESVIEIGGGNALMRSVLKQACRATKYISSDISPTENTDVICDAQDMIFLDGEADLIAAFEVMEHIPDTNMFLSEVNRVLRPGGYIVISVPFLYGKHDFQDFYRWTSQGLERVINENGMNVLLMKNRGGVFLTIVSLLSNYIHSKFQPSENNWRARGIWHKIYFGCMAIMMLPIHLLSWLALLVDMFVDRNSANPSGFILIAQKPEVSVENTLNT